MSSPPLPRSPSTPEAFGRVVESYVSEINVALPGRVETYDATKQTADIKPLVKRRVRTESGAELLEELPVIPGVPVAFPRGGGFFLSFPLERGDFVELVFHSRSIDKWFSGDGGDTDPDDFRTHDLSDAVAHPGLYPLTRALAQADASKMVVGADGGLQMRIGDALIELGTTGGALDFVALAQKVATELTRIQTYMTALDTVLRLPVNEPGNGAPSAFQAAIGLAIAAVPYPAPASVAASKVKAE